MFNNLKPTETSFTALQHTQTPRTRDLVIFVQMTTMTTDIQTDYFTPCACTWGNEDILYKCTIDKIRLRLISNLRENYKMLMNIHELQRAAVYGSNRSA